LAFAAARQSQGSQKATQIGPFGRFIANLAQAGYAFAMAILLVWFTVSNASQMEPFIGIMVLAIGVLLVKMVLTLVLARKVPITIPEVLAYIQGR
jgi:hypothetical protein